MRQKKYSFKWENDSNIREIDHEESVNTNCNCKITFLGTSPIKRQVRK
jgi:hypothetical protein